MIDKSDIFNTMIDNPVMPKILQVTPVLQTGGAEHVAAWLAHAFANPEGIAVLSVVGGPYEDYLQARGVNVEILEPWLKRWLRRNAARKFMGRIYYKILARLRDKWLHSTQLPLQCNVLERELPGYSNRFSSFLDSHEYAVFHIHSLTCAHLFKLAKQKGCKVIYGHHNILSERHSREDIEFLREQLHWVDAVVCVSNASRDDFVKTTGFPAEKVHTIPNPSFLASGIQVNFPAVAIAGTASNLQSAKGIDVLLSAWRLLTDRGIHIPLHIAGGSSEALGHWRSVVNNLGLCGLVKFHGNLDEHEMLKFYDTIQLMLIPSLTEAFSLQLIEALSRGLPVVASNLPALSEILGQAGILFPAGNPSQLADSVERLYKNPIEACEMGSLGFRRWQEFYSTELIKSKYLILYRKICGLV